MIDPVTPDYFNTPVSANRPSYGYQIFDQECDPVVSIITPFFNTGAEFYETARSILNQSLQQWEWLIINDGSTNPDSLEILNEFRNVDSRIHVIDHETNQGLSTARNTGFRLAKSYYIVQIDSDDLIEPNTIEIWRWCLESYPEFSFVKGYSVGFGAQNYLWKNGFHSGKKFLMENQVDATAMIRKDAHERVGGYDPEIKGGLEDWDFWLKCAASGYWGKTIPEFQDWYRRRIDHSDHWSNWNQQSAVTEHFQKKYPSLWKEAFPEVFIEPQQPHSSIDEDLPWTNELRKGEQQRILMIFPWMEMGGADRFNLDLIQQLARFGWQTTIITTLPGANSWLPHFTNLTPDVFVLPHFLKPVDYPRFIRYIIQSRKIDLLLISNSELGYMLIPYLRHYFPKLPMVDFCHMEEEYYKNGGYARQAVESQTYLDRNIVSSHHLKEWMTNRGADKDKIEVCYTNIELSSWQPDAAMRSKLRNSLSIRETTTVILYAARLCPQKQPFVFLKTIEKLKERKLDIVALVVGKGEDAEAMKEYIDEHHLSDCVRMLGSVPNDYVNRLMKASDIFFLPSHMEGIAITLYEAMASSLPVVGADVGGQRELVSPECGILIQKGEPDREVEKYVEILSDLICNPQRRIEMGAASRKRLENRFELFQMGERFQQILVQVKQNRQTIEEPPIPKQVGLLSASHAIEYLRLNNDLQVAHNIIEQFSQSLAKQIQAIPVDTTDSSSINTRVSASLEMAKSIGVPEIVCRAYFEAGKLYTSLGNNDIALKYYTIALGLTKKFHNTSLTDPILSAFRRAKNQSQSSPISAPSSEGDNSLVSVIIPTYNRKTSLWKALDSVTSQTYPNIEIIVVNDGGECVDDLIDAFTGHANILYIEHSRNSGTGSARNTGIKHANGAFIAFLDDDDVYHPNHISTLVQCLKKNTELIAAYSNAYEVTQSEQSDCITMSEAKVRYSVDYSQQQLLVRNYIPILCLLVRRDAIHAAGPFDTALKALEDWEWLIRLSEKGQIRHIPVVTATYFVHEGKTRNWLDDHTIRDLYRSIYAKTTCISNGETKFEQFRLYAAITSGRNLIFDFANSDELLHFPEQTVATFEALLETEDIPNYVIDHMDRISKDLLFLIQLNEASALKHEDTDLASGLHDLGDYIRDYLEEQNQCDTVRAKKVENKRTEKKSHHHH